MISLARLDPRATRVLVGALVAAIVVTLAMTLVHGWRGHAALPIHNPARLALVYAKPTGPGLAVRSETVYAASPTGTDPIPLGEGTAPLVSPDGRWVAFTSGPVSHPGPVLLASTLGGRPRVTGVAGGAVAWSPDSRVVAVTS